MKRADRGRGDRDDEQGRRGGHRHGRAQLPGIDVAGKTGTAEIDDRRDINQPWFIAFAPADNPRIAIAVTVERVQGGFGGDGRRADRQGGHGGSSCAKVMTEIGGPPARDRSTAATGSCSASGSGGMADVYCAEDQQLGRQVALKLLLPPLRRGRRVRRALPPRGVERRRPAAPERRRRLRPRRVGRHLLHRDGVPRRPLAQAARSSEEAPLDPVRAIDLAVQILRAARFAHRRGVIHRDLKPHNVIVDDEDRAKVTDFGIARAGASDMTQTGSIMGTAQYLSPEQAQGHAVTPASDLYSIGIVLYEMLTGRVPFDGESAVTIALKQVNEAPVPPEPATRRAAGLEARRAAGAGEGPGARASRRRRVHRRARGRRATGSPTGRSRRARRRPRSPPSAPPGRAAAPRPTASPPRRSRRRDERSRDAGRWWPRSALAVLAAALIALGARAAADGGKTGRRCRGVVGRSATRRAPCCDARASRSTIERRVRRQRRADEVIGQDPAPATRGRRRARPSR